MNSIEAFLRRKARERLAPRVVDSLYRGLLGRAAEPEALAKHGARYGAGSAGIAQLAAEIAGSAEFRARHGIGAVGAPPSPEPAGCLRSEAEAVFTPFRAEELAGEPGFVTNFMGGRLRVAFVAGIEALSGVVEGPPLPGNCHGDALEWLGTLRAVEEAGDAFTVLELGAGWGPWCAIAHRGARMRGIADIRVVAVEGEAGHIGFIHQHFQDNGVPAEAARVLHGVAGPRDGIAEFPRQRRASSDYGGAAAFGEAPGERAGLDYFVELRGDNLAEVERLPCHSLATLLAPHDRVDLVHCDVQGAEEGVFAAGMEAANAKVRRVVVGTHSFALDRAMLALFARAGWTCEGIFACEMQEQATGLAVTVKDGCQVWRNPRV
jgi:FkbM family methyltransferase